MKTKTVVPMTDEKTKKITTVYYSDGSVDYLNAAKNQTLAYVERNAIFLAKSNWLNNIKNFAILFLFSAIYQCTIDINRRHKRKALSGVHHYLQER